MRIHVFQTGRLVGNRTFLRSESFTSLLRAPEPYEFPAFAFVLEHPEGPIAIDTGMVASTHTPRWQRRFAPVGHIEPEQEIGPQLRAAGIDPRDVRRVVVTHPDWDHVGGVGHFPGAEVLMHRPDWAFAQTMAGRMRFGSSRWTFTPSLYDLEEAPLGPFPQSRRIADGVHVVPLPGHTPGQVGVVVEERMLFCADHVLSQEWFEEDVAAGRLLGLGIWQREAAVETTRRVQAFMAQPGALLLPSHDAETPARLRRDALSVSSSAI